MGVCVFRLASAVRVALAACAAAGGDKPFAGLRPVAPQLSKGAQGRLVQPRWGRARTASDQRAQRATARPEGFARRIAK